MSMYSIFGTKIQPKFTNDSKNILKVSSKKEIFFDVFECQLNGKDIVVEKTGQYENTPIVKFEIKDGGNVFTCEALLVIDKENDLYLNENNLEFSKNIKVPIVEKTIVEEVKKIVPTDTLHEEKIQNISDKIVAESEEKARLIQEAKLKEYELKQEQIIEQSENYLNGKFDNYIKENIHTLVTDSNLVYDKLVENLNNLDDGEIKDILGERIRSINEELNHQLKNEVTSMKKYVEMSSGGGGTNAKQYANGGKMNGDLHVTGKVTAGTIAGSTELQGGTIDGDLTVTGSISTDTITATTLLSTTQIDFVSETNGFDVSGDITSSGSITATNITGTLTTAAQPNITSLGQLGGLNLSDAAEISHGSDWTIKTPGTSPNQTFEIYSEVNGATEFKIADTGDITAGNIAATLTTAAQPNITSVGGGNGLTVSGPISGTLQTNNNKSVVIGAFAAPNESAPNFGTDPVLYRENIAIGYEALKSVGTGTNNVAIGSAALSAVTSGKNNIAIGKKALATITHMKDRNIVLGFNALNVANVDSDNIVIGVTNLQNTIAGNIQGNTVIGRNAGSSTNVGTGNFIDNVILGRAAFKNATVSKVEDCILIGDKAGESLKGEGNNDIGIGRNAFFGANAGFNSGGNNIAIGQSAQSNPIEATAKVNGATSSTTALVVDSNAGIILPGMTVTGTGISGTVTVTTVTDQNTLVLSSAQTLSNDVDLTFTVTEPIKGSIKIGADGGTAGNFSSNISTVDTASTLPGGGNRTVNKVTGSHSGLIGGYANIVSAETSFVGAGKNNVIAEQATGAAILGGFDNEITGVGSAGMALGSNLKVQGSNQVVVGRFNVGNNNSKFIVGSGFSNANRINALEIKNNHQLKLGKYGLQGASTNYPASSGLRTYNVLAVGTANNVVEIPLHHDRLDSQYLEPDIITVSGGTTDLGTLLGKIVKIVWDEGASGNTSSSTGSLNLPKAANFKNKTVRFVVGKTNYGNVFLGTINIHGNAAEQTASGNFTDTINGLHSGQTAVSLAGTYKTAMLWSDGTEWYIIGD